MPISRKTHWNVFGSVDWTDLFLFQKNAISLLDCLTSPVLYSKSSTKNIFCLFAPWRRMNRWVYFADCSIHWNLKQWRGIAGNIIILCLSRAIFIRTLLARYRSLTPLIRRKIFLFFRIFCKWTLIFVLKTQQAVAQSINLFSYFNIDSDECHVLVSLGWINKF